MPIPNILVLNAFGSLPLQVHELQGGTTPSQIGSNITTGSPAVFVPGLVIKGNHGHFSKTFKGERYCLTLTAGGVHVRRENEGGAGVWGIVFAHTAGATFNGPEYFLHVVKDGSDTALVMGYAAGAAPHIRTAKSNTGQSGSWTEVNFILGVFGRITSSSVVFRNRIYWHDSINTITMEFDPAAATLSTVAVPWLSESSAASVDFCVAFDRLFAAAVDLPDNPLGVLRLYEFTGGGWSENSQIGATLGQNDGITGQSGKNCLWTDNANLYVVGYAEKNDVNTDVEIGSSVWRGVPSGAAFTWTQNDTTMVSGLRPGVRGPVLGARQDRWSIFVDNDTDPANPAYYLIVVQGLAPGTGHAVYLWNGFGVEMGPTPGASVSIAFSLPEQKTGGGEAISQGAATYGEIEIEAAIPGAYQLSYRTPGVIAGLTGRVYFSLGQGPPDTIATLIGGGTTFGPITGDARASLRTVDVDIGLSGISGPDASNWLIDLRP